MAEAVDLLVPPAAAAEVRTLALALALALARTRTRTPNPNPNTWYPNPNPNAAEEGGDGGGERMVASVRAQLLPLLPPPAQGVEQSAVVAADPGGEAAGLLRAREAEAVPLPAAAQSASGA